MYDYQTEKPKVFTEGGVKMLLQIRENVDRLLKSSGAFMEHYAHQGVTGDSWQMIACLDYLCEVGVISKASEVGARQHTIYRKGQD